MFDWIRNALARQTGRPMPGAAAASRSRVDAWVRQADALRRAGDKAQAEALCRRILDEDPDCVGALYLLGEFAADRAEYQEAAGLFGRALSLDGKNAQIHYALGCVLGSAGDWPQAVASYRRALALSPEHVGAHLNLGCLLQWRGEARAGASHAPPDNAADELEEAQSHFRTATSLAPDHPDAWINLGYALARQRRPRDAERCYDRALAIDPGLDHARFNRAMVRLAQGRFAEGWSDYESRWAAGGFPRPAFDRPEWDGSAIGGKTILLYTEQGFGDAIQFARYAALLAERGARPLLRCPPQLKRLMESVPGVAGVTTPEEALPPFDIHCALLGLPRLFETTVETIPAAVPYVSPPADRVLRWRMLLEKDAAALKVGLVWASQSAMPGAELKSAPLTAFAPLRDVAGARYYSLQLGEAAGQAAAADAPFALRDLTEEIGDFADTAALIAQLDLVISVDTAVAHLAGAMGRPVWTLLPFVADWRWEPDVPTTRWYPTMRLYRQSARGRWDDVLARVAGDLGRFRPATRVLLR
jgi:tetratricopeptide (TPR) repeat protein